MRIDPEFKSLIPDLSDEEYQQLQINILRDGVLSPVVVWKEEGILVDGHNRFDICERNEVTLPPARELSFASRDDAKIWIIKNQFGRRNLTSFQRAELALQLEPLLKEKGKANQIAGGENKVSQNSEKAPVDRYKEIGKAAGVSHDTIAKVKTIVEQAPEDVKESLRRGDISIHQAHKNLKREEKREQIEQSSEATISQDLWALINQEKKFTTIYADPPWSYGNQSTRGATDDHYPTMSVEEIAALPVVELAAEEAHLHLWTTNAFLFDAKRVMEAWGFEYKSCYVWVKPQIGMGNYWRVSHEFLLFGIRGGLKFQDRSERSWGEFNRTKHSAKPEEIRKLIEVVSPGPYLELFGRKEIDGWTVFGNQIPKTLFCEGSK